MSTPLTIREQVKQIATAMRGNPSPADVRDSEVTLAGLLWLINDELRLAEMEFRVALLGASTHTKSSAAAKQVAEAGPSYARLLEAKATHESCMEMLRTCRSHGRSLSEEMRLQR